MATTGKYSIAVVTGGGRGIGRAIALRLGQDGFCVAVHYGAREKDAQSTADAIKEAGGQAFVFRTDLSEPGEGKEFWQSFESGRKMAGYSGPVQVLVNNAGVTLRGAIEDLGSDEFAKQTQINVNAPYFIVKEGLRLLEDGGRVINISSGVRRIAFPEIIGYAMTKGALDAFTFTLAKHLGGRGITVNGVAPGVVDTDINASWLRGNAQAEQAVSDSTALGRVGQPDDIAGIVSFLASQDAGWVTGQILDATGGTQL